MKALMTLAGRTDDYPEREQVEEVLEGIRLQNLIEDLRKQNEIRRSEELYQFIKREMEASETQRAQEGNVQGQGEARGSQDQAPSFRAIKVVKIEVEEEERSGNDEMASSNKTRKRIKTMVGRGK